MATQFDSSILYRLSASKGVITAVKHHIRRGDNPNARDEDGRTPLLLAALHGHSEVYRLIISAGGDPSIEDRDGKDAYALAVDYGHLELAEEILCSKFIEKSASDSSQAAANQFDSWEEERSRDVESGASLRIRERALAIEKIIKRSISIDDGAEWESSSDDESTQETIRNECEDVEDPKDSEEEARGGSEGSDAILQEIKFELEKRTSMGASFRIADALELRAPKNVDYWVAAAIALHDLGEHYDAWDCWNLAVRQPDFDSSRFDYRLMRNELMRGYKIHEDHLFSLIAVSPGSGAPHSHNEHDTEDAI